jgi:hypothetical protein
MFDSLKKPLIDKQFGTGIIKTLHSIPEQHGIPFRVTYPVILSVVCEESQATQGKSQGDCASLTRFL